MKKKIGDYIMEKKIGSGAFGEVYYSTKIDSTEEFAIKMMSKDKMSAKLRGYLDREIEILQLLDNPHIIKLKDLKVSEHNYYLIFEYCNGGDLASYKKAKGGRVSELATRRLMRQIVSALYTVYASGGIHRDIKLGNVLLHYPTEAARERDEPVSKLCDFGFARMVETAGDSEVPLEMSIVGTPINMSPELLLHRPYTVKSDMWSLGTVTYELLCGSLAFIGMNKVHLTKTIETGIYKINKSLALSTESVDFLTSCLQHNFNDRVSWEELKMHPFILTDTITPFCFEIFKKHNPKVSEEKRHYILSSKVRYNFTRVYKESKEKELKRKREEEEKRLQKLEQEEFEAKKRLEEQKKIEETESPESDSTETSPRSVKATSKKSAKPSKQSPTMEDINDYVLICLALN
eukprot:TRINITY_DN7017_c0_g2_i8.p1 TRINITY_DN7017_c0_g2~~TRINITY_DN7017_c0_g2_i8.p1  ORF type:complete len:424 (-),score=94.18 TRINITY_DN7017_c0_g2_i8:146-1360(-)